MQSIRICILFLFVLSNLCGQEKKNEHLAHGLVLGFDFSCYTSAEIGYGFATEGIYYHGRETVIDDKAFLVFTDLTFGIQFPKQILFTPKLSTKISFELRDWEFTLWGMNIGCDYIHYTDFKKAVPVIRPNAGLFVLIGTAELSYGYSIPFNRNETFRIPQDAVNLRVRPYIIIRLLESFG